MSEKKQFDFKQELDRLNTIVNTISNKTLPFEECLSLYEEGLKIVKCLEEELKASEEKLEKVVEIK
jgi:exodeoxyribonuclease VII small subunit